MLWKTRFLCATLALSALLSATAQAEILAMLNYESKPEQSIRREGIAVIDIDPKSANFGKILKDIPLPPDLIAHHLYYNKDKSKAYVTALGKSVLHVIDMHHFPDNIKTVDVPDCKVGEDMAFSDDNKTWYLTCMGSDNVIVGDAGNDKPLKTIAASGPDKAFIRHPHGIALHNGIDRILVTSTLSPDKSGDAGESVTVIEASSGKVLSTHKVSLKPSPSGEAPVDVAFVPGSNPPLAYITNMLGGTLWTAVWNPAKKAFDFSQAYDFAPQHVSFILGISFNKNRDRLFVTTAKPGHLNIFDIGKDAARPALLKSIPTAGGAHHVVFSPDERYVFVQNSFVNRPEMNDGSITVIDLANNTVIANINTLKERGFNPNSIVLLP